jgi:RNA polymerase sigma-70 factor (ECF subfamily)
MDAAEVAAIADVRAGRTDAFRTLVDRHSRAIYRLAYRMTRNESDADDVVQETFMRAYRNLGSFNARASFGTWLYRIATNAALDMIAKRRRENEEPIDEQLPSRSASTDDAVLMRVGVTDALDRGMRALSGNERTAFVLRHYEGLSIDEISAVLGTQVSATKNTIFRAVRKLRQVLEPLV